MSRRRALLVVAAVIAAVVAFGVGTQSVPTPVAADVTLPTLATTTTTKPPPPTALKETQRYMTDGASCETGGCHDLDVYYQTKTSAQPRPAVIFIHQGGWTGGSKSDGIKAFADDLILHVQPTWVAFSINYKLNSSTFTWPAPATPPPVGPYPPQKNEVAQAVAWVQSQAATYNIDASKVAVFGGSAGAHLAALVGASQPGAPGSSGKPAAVVEWSGPTNMADILADQGCSNTVCNPSAQYAGAAVEQFEGKCLPVAPAPGPNFKRCPDNRYAETSGVTYVSRCSPPMYLAHSMQDTTVPFEQEQQLASALYTAGVPYEHMIIYSGAEPPHSEPYNQNAKYQNDPNAVYDHSYYWSQNARSKLPDFAKTPSFNFLQKYLVQTPYQPTGC